jgi:enoyl-CoA hydratase
MAGQDWFIDQTGPQAGASPTSAAQATDDLSVKESFTMPTQNTSTVTPGSADFRTRAALDTSQAHGAAIPKLNDKGRVADIPLSPDAKITVERRGQIVLIGINRPQIYNRFDPDAFFGLATAYYHFDNDPSLRAAVLFGHGPSFSRGIDVDAFAPLAETGQPFAVTDGMLDPFARTQHLSKPLIAVVHGDTWNMAHELHLVADIRVASADVRFGQDENTHGRFPGGGSTIRFPREAGWGNAMRYMLAGDHWGAQEAYRMGLIQQIAPNPAEALQAGIDLARKIAACGPLGIKTTLTSAHLAIDESEAAAFAELNEQFGALFRTEDFIEGREADAQGRRPVYHGK